MTSLSEFFRERLLWNLVIYRYPRSASCYDTTQIANFIPDNAHIISGQSYLICNICRKAVYKYFEWRLLSEGPTKPLDLDLCQDCSRGKAIIAWFHSQLGEKVPLSTNATNCATDDVSAATVQLDQLSSETQTEKMPTDDITIPLASPSQSEGWLSSWWNSSSAPKEPLPVIRALIEKTGYRNPALDKYHSIKEKDAELTRKLNHVTMLERLHEEALQRNSTDNVSHLADNSPARLERQSTALTTALECTEKRNKPQWKRRFKSFFIEN